MLGYLSLGFAVLTAVIGYAAGQGGNKAILKRLEADFEILKGNIIYRKNCELEMTATKDRLNVLEKKSATLEREMSESKSQIAVMMEMLKTLQRSMDELKSLIKNGR